MMKVPGVCYAMTDEGLEIPVIDITHDAFAIDPTTEELAAISAQSLSFLKQSIGVPTMLQKMFTRGSILLREAHGKSSYLSGMTTYLQKLGPGNLGAGYANDLDRKVAGSIGPVSERMRLQDISGLLADGLAPALTTRPRRPIQLISIGGGPAPECWNALILLHHTNPNAVAGRSIHIRILDLDREGPAFGGRCLTALRAEGSPLHGLDVVCEPIVYDWADVAILRRALEGLIPDSVAAGSAEGGLFEYGSDSEIVANLEVLQTGTPEDFRIVGSVVRDEATADPSLPVLRDMRGIPPRLLGLEAFGALAATAGWRVARAIEGNPFYHVVELSKM
jgi:hypothetical protein